MASSDPEQSLHTPETTTGYQPYRLEPTEQGDHPYGSPARGTVAAISYEPMKATNASSRSSSASRSGIVQAQMEQIRTMNALLEHHGLEVPKADDGHLSCSSMQDAGDRYNITTTSCNPFEILSSLGVLV